MVSPRATQHYDFEVPLDQAGGLFWYHDHVHGLVADHVSRGAAGMLYVANAYTERVSQLGIRHRLMLLQHAYFDEGIERLRASKRPSASSSTRKS
jgi:FtsP/CotA-like multicopper oxidase with cupredoxin domain